MEKGEMKTLEIKRNIQRQYKEPRWVENQKAIYAKIRGIPLGWGPRQKLGIIPEEEGDSQ